MSDYSITYDFSAKDALATGDGNKLILGSEVDTETLAIKTAVNSKADIANPTFTGEIGIGSVNVSETELGILEGLTSTTTELNLINGVTATTAEINYLDDDDLTAADLTKLAALTSTAAELNKIDGSASDASTVIVDADQIIINNGGTMEQTAVTDLITYMNGGLKTKLVDIGDWDMNADSSYTVAHGLTLANVRGMSATIRRDDGLVYYQLETAFTDGAQANGGILWDATNATLVRDTGGSFDNTSFDDYGGTQGNRGWITICYV